MMKEAHNLNQESIDLRLRHQTI